MKSRSTYRGKPQHGRGFTLIELLLVVALTAVLASVGLFTTFDAYRFTSARSERDIVVTELEKARSEAMNNVDEKPHGFCVQQGRYALFAGDDCTSASEYELTDALGAATLTGLPDSGAGVYFKQLSGEAASADPLVTFPLALTISDGSQSRTITINREGMIDW